MRYEKGNAIAKLNRARSWGTVMLRFLSLIVVLGSAALGAFALGPGAPNASAQAPSTPPAAKKGLATFAGGGCWCVESDFDKVDGVVSPTTGYAGGSLANPTYQQVSAGGTGHAEAVEIVYDAAKVSYEKLLDVFWHNHDPFAKNAQFCDHGDQYRAAIFYHNEEQRQLAEASKQAVQARFKEPVQTEINAAGPFYAAEEYHQDFYKKNPIRYKFYRLNCGRDKRLEAIWGKAESVVGSH